MNCGVCSLLNTALRTLLLSVKLKFLKTRDWDRRLVTTVHSRNIDTFVFFSHFHKLKLILKKIHLLGTELWILITLQAGKSWPTLLWLWLARTCCLCLIIISGGDLFKSSVNLSLSSFRKHKTIEEECEDTEPFISPPVFLSLMISLCVQPCPQPATSFSPTEIWTPGQTEG